MFCLVCGGEGGGGGRGGGVTQIWVSSHVFEDSVLTQKVSARRGRSIHVWKALCTDFQKISKSFRCCR